MMTVEAVGKAKDTGPVFLKGGAKLRPSRISISEPGPRPAVAEVDLPLDGQAWGKAREECVIQAGGRAIFRGKVARIQHVDCGAAHVSTVHLASPASALESSGSWLGTKVDAAAIARHVAEVMAGLTIEGCPGPSSKRPQFFLLNDPLWAVLGRMLAYSGRGMLFPADRAEVLAVDPGASGSGVAARPAVFEHPVTDVRPRPRFHLLGPDPESPFGMVEAPEADGSGADFWLGDSSGKGELGNVRKLINSMHGEDDLTLTGGPALLGMGLGSPLGSGLVCKRAISWTASGGWTVTVGTGYSWDYLAQGPAPITKGQVVGVGERGGLVVRLPRFRDLRVEVGFPALVGGKGQGEGDQGGPAPLAMLAPYIAGSWGTVTFPDNSRDRGVWTPDAPPGVLTKDLIETTLLAIRGPEAEILVKKDGTASGRTGDSRLKAKKVDVECGDISTTMGLWKALVEAIRWRKK